ncbi:MAG: NAD(P)/FAD-dependent oxidoreductase, partial [Candidatus Rokuibacteriota bacterium]
MSPTADIVIIGGGANGTSTAFHLARMGATNVRLLERRHLAAGATGKSGALVRMHYTNEHESRLAIESLKIFREFSAIVGGDCGFETPGFLQIVPPGYEAAMRRNLARQQRLGVDTREVSRDDVRELFPECRVDDIGAAAWEPGSGYADPSATAFAFAAAAQRLGVTIENGCHVTRILTEGGRVTGVETAGGRVEAPVVVLVPGAWGQPLLDPLGLDYGLQPFRIQVSLFRWPPALTRKHPVVIDAGQKAWIRPVDGNLSLIGVELGAAYGGDPDKLHEGVDEGYVA